MESKNTLQDVTPSVVGIVIPLYKNPQLVLQLENNLLTIAPELAALPATVIFVNDSPDDIDLAVVLLRAVATLRSHVRVEVLTNSVNRGFVESTNRGLDWCLEHGADALLLNSDALLAEGCLTELRRVSTLDPLIGLVCPRSNNATLCSLPFRWPKRQLPFEQALEAARKISQHLPEYTLVPTGVGFCMYIRNVVLIEFGLLDEAYSPGYHEENDFCMRANRCGFRVVLANKAFCYHAESLSFASEKKRQLNERNQKILDARYPEYLRAVDEYFAGPDFSCELALAALAEGNLYTPRLLIDLSHFNCACNGTYEYGKKITRALLDLHSPMFDISIMCGEAEAKYHELATLFPEAPIVPLHTDEVFHLALKPAQPFKLEDLKRLSRTAIFNFYVMLDTISLDCAYIRPRTLAPVWDLMARYSDGLAFISQFSRDQFTRRLKTSQHTELITALCSTDIEDYRGPASEPVSDEAKPRLTRYERYVLVIGNHYEHKFITPTVKALVEQIPDANIVVLGACHFHHERVEVVPSGQLSQEDVDRVYAEALCLVFPSTYEGFGFPILHALAKNKVVFVRDSSLNREIIGSWNGSGALAPYTNTPELKNALPHFLRDGIQGLQRIGLPIHYGNPENHHGWREVAQRLATMMTNVLSRSECSPLLRDRAYALAAASEASAWRDTEARWQEVAREREETLQWKHNAEVVALLGRIDGLQRLAAEKDARIEEIERACGHHEGLFKEVVGSRSFRLGRSVTKVASLFPVANPAFRLLRKR